MLNFYLVNWLSVTLSKIPEIIMNATKGTHTHTHTPYVKSQPDMKSYKKSSRAATALPSCVRSDN